MILVSKQEKEIIMKECPKAHIVRTMKQKSKRHKYYCEETERTLGLVDRIRRCPDNRKGCADDRS